MSKEQRYTYYIDEFDEFDWAITDNITDESYEYLEDIAKVLNEQDQKIKDLQHRLSNCIEPKFKVEQEVWFIDPEKDISKGEVLNIEFINNQIVYTVLWGNDYEDIYYKYELFATEEEAKAKLEEIQDGSICD